MSKADPSSKKPATEEFTPERPWPLRVPQIGAGMEDFIKLAAQRTGRPESDFVYPWQDAHYYEMHAAAADGELGNFFSTGWLKLASLITGEEQAHLEGHVAVPKIRRHKNYWPFRLMLSWMWHHHVKNEYWRVLNTRRPLPDGKEALLAFPDHPAWTKEESLALKFGAAAMERRMTDELWQAAVATWGQNLAMRYIMFLGYYYMWNTLLEAVGVTRFIGSITPLDTSQNPNSEGA